LKVKRTELVNDLFIFFIPHPTPPLVHAWCKVKVMDVTDQAIPDATAAVKVLRNNLQAGFRSINRIVALYSQDDGYLAAFGTRKVVGLPTGWPLVINVTKDGYVLRGHMLKLAKDDSPHNLEPLDAPDDRTGIKMLANNDVDLSDKTILLDPGHGVVYADTGNRRVYEWFSANQMAEKVASILTSRFKLPEANVLWTRTAGFGLIAPNEIAVDAAPEHGKARYSFDLSDPAARKISAKAALAAEKLSDLLLTGHAEDNSVVPPLPSRRNDLIQNNAATVETATQRLMPD
jgi:N-acetylmuramoyl-L-alanine amidase